VCACVCVYMRARGRCEHWWRPPAALLFFVWGVVDVREMAGAVILRSLSLTMPPTALSMMMCACAPAHLRGHYRRLTSHISSLTHALSLSLSQGGDRATLRRTVRVQFKQNVGLTDPTQVSVIAMWLRESVRERLVLLLDAKSQRT